VELEDAKELWGLDIFLTQRMIMKRHGPAVKSITIGPAGERLSRIAIIATETSNAAGQGGFGAVMGSKNLKAVTVKGEGGVRIADPESFMEINKDIRNLSPEYVPPPNFTGLRPERYKVKYNACGGCAAGCRSRIVIDVPGRVHPGLNTALTTCVEERWLQKGWGFIDSKYAYSYPELPKDMPQLKDLEAAFEAKVLADKYGLNMWELTVGLVPWLNLCKNAGIITEKDLGIPLELEKGEFWSTLFQKIAYREGIGAILAEGLVRATAKLGKGDRYVPHVAHGYVEGAVLGRGFAGCEDRLPFPFWIITALAFSTDSRDPSMPSAVLVGWDDFHDLRTNMPIERSREISKRVYGTEKTVDPTYEYKACRTIWHQNRAAVEDMLVLCSWKFPILINRRTRSDFGDTALESRLFSAATGIDASEADLDKVGERIFNLERAIMVREGRDRNYDVNCGVIKYLKDRPDTDGIRLDEDRFLKSLDEYYFLRGWDISTGWPKEEKLLELGLEDVSDQLKKSFY
jgi:aldehyde:ferredoxin oxidoreductase